MKRILYAVLLISFIAFAATAVANIRQAHLQVKVKEIQLQDTGAQLQQLNDEYNKLLQQKEVDQQKLKELEEHKTRLEAELQAKLDRKEAERVALENASKIATTRAYAAQANCGSPKACIYMKESGNNPAAINSIGCRGLGQACPGSKLPCSDTDYACQDAWFTNYAIQRYGGWEQAWVFWQANKWW